MILVLACGDYIFLKASRRHLRYRRAPRGNFSKFGFLAG
jgi:hypothetical protein